MRAFLTAISSYSKVRKMAKHQEISFTDKDKNLLERLAYHLSMTLEEVTTHLLSSELANRYKRGTGKAPANVYPIKRAD
jgi:hypothetical protein